MLPEVLPDFLPYGHLPRKWACGRQSTVKIQQAPSFDHTHASFVALHDFKQ
jgi:hypothetical protein